MSGTLSVLRIVRNLGHIALVWYVLSLVYAGRQRAELRANAKQRLHNVKKNTLSVALSEKVRGVLFASFKLKTVIIVAVR